MDDQDSCGSGYAEPKFTITADTYEQLKAQFDKIYAVELRRLYHEEQNRLFDKMSKKRQRLTIAQDVLDQLGARKIKALRGSFLDQILPGGGQDKSRQVSEILEKQSSCSVCALGGMFVCAVKRLDNLAVEDLRAGHHEEVTVSSSDIKGYLTRCFNTEQLELIEIAFESGHGAYNIERSASPALRLQQIRAKRYCRRERSSTKRMQKIMRNIIRNGGKFVP